MIRRMLEVETRTTVVHAVDPAHELDPGTVLVLVGYASGRTALVACDTEDEARQVCKAGGGSIMTAARIFARVPL